MKSGITENIVLDKSAPVTTIITRKARQMRINTQFPVAVHILSVLAYFREESLPSDIIAQSVGTNPVVVRRIMARLKKKGLVNTQSGVRGAVLRKEPQDITLLEIYNAVRSKDDTLFDIHPNPNHKCPVGAYFCDALEKPLAEAQRAMERELASFTLSDVLKPITQGNRKSS